MTQPAPTTAHQAAGEAAQASQPARSSQHAGGRPRKKNVFYNKKRAAHLRAGLTSVGCGGLAPRPRRQLPGAAAQAAEGWPRGRLVAVPVRVLPRLHTRAKRARRNA
jgi:hypothetical protein